MLKFDELSTVVDQESIWRQKQARKSLSWFIKATMEAYRPNWHHVETCRVLRKWLDGEIQNLIISQPPRHGKSQIGSIHLPGFIFGQNPDARIIATAYSASLATKNNRSVQKLIDSAAYQSIFPETRLSGPQSRFDDRAVRNSAEFEIVGRRGTYRGAGIGGPITGFGADYFIIDDPIKNEEEANSETHREANWEWWLSTALTRLEEDSRVLLIMTRWHEDDLAGRLLKQAKDDKNALQWHEVNFEATREDMKPNLNDPRKIGEALWPSKYPESRLKMLQSTLGPRWWNSLYQQRPTALEGGIIKMSHIKYWRPKELPPLWHRMFQTWDLTFKEGQRTDFVVGQVWGVFAGKKYLLDQVRGRWGFLETKDNILDLCAKWPQASIKLIENKANGEAIVDALKNRGVRSDGVTPHGPITGIIKFNPEGSKAERLEAVADEFAAGDVLYPHPEIAPWIATNIDEIVKFPNAAHDDTVDPTTQLLLHLSGGKSGVLDKIARM